MNENILTWNLPNFLTIGIMALLFAAVAGLVITGVGKVGSSSLGSNGTGNGSGMMSGSGK
jgi:hypothetical protein